MNGKPSTEPGRSARNAWKKQTVLCEHELPGTARHDPLALPAESHGRLARPPARRARAAEARRRARPPSSIEHEYPRARIQDKERLKPILAGLDRLHAQDRRGRRLHVRASARGAARRRTSPCRAAGASPTGPSREKLQHDQRKLNVALIGYDFMGRAHATPGARWGGSSRSPARARAQGRVRANRGRGRGGRRAPRLRGARDAAGSEVVGRKDIDVVDICTPGDSHVEIAIAAAEAKKAILCEKPLANTLADAERMLDAVAEGRASSTCSATTTGAARRGAGRAAHRRGTHRRRSATTAGVYLQDWIVDPELPARVAAREGARRLGRARRHPVAHAGSVALPRRRAGRGHGPAEDVHHRAAAARGSRPARQVDVDDAALALVKFENGAIGCVEGIALRARPQELQPLRDQRQRRAAWSGTSSA